MEWWWEMGQLETDKERICQRISRAHKCSESHIKPGRVTGGAGWLSTFEEVWRRCCHPETEEAQSPGRSVFRKGKY